MKNYLFLIILVFLSVWAEAQDLYVKSFQAMPMDMTASSIEGKRIDQNGEAAALIKMVTPEKGFFFDGGTLGIVDTKEETGEIWVWVPRAARKITIGHPQLGVIKNYEYPLTIESERTYEMVLMTEKEETMGSLEVKTDPEGVTIYLDGKDMGVTPKLVTGMTEGEHELRLHKQLFEDYETTIVAVKGERAKLHKVLGREGAVKGLFSVSETQQVVFSQGNLQYQPSTKKWRFAEHQYDVLHSEDKMVDNEWGVANLDVTNEYASSYDGWIGHFGWGTSGWNNGNSCYQPNDTAITEGYGPTGKNDLTGAFAQSDWGVHNPIINGGNQPGQWRTLTHKELNYLLNSRNTDSGIRYVYANVNGINGLVILPDQWDVSCYSLSDANGGNYGSNTITTSQWHSLEQKGAVFFPANGRRGGSGVCSMNSINTHGFYWSASYGGDDGSAFLIQIADGGLSIDLGGRFFGFGIRLVHDAEPVDAEYIKEQNATHTWISFKVDADAEIWVDGEKKDFRSWSGSLALGDNRIECRQANHETSVKTIHVDKSMEGQAISLPVPIPIYGSLSVKSTPDHVKVFIDGNDMGETPINLPEFIIGQHELRLVKDGYVDHVETFSLTKGEKKQLNVKLNKGHAIQFTCNVCDAQLEIDGKKVGPAVGSYQLTNGSHKLKATAVWYRDCDFTLKVDDNSNPSHNIIMECVAKAEETFKVNGVSFTMKLVEGGSFMMGSEDAGFNTKPVHEVTLSTYYLGATEVTQALWMAVMESEPTDQEGGWTEQNGKGDNVPAYKVNWNACQKFISKLNEMTGRNFRLPTEAEWEYAARGGNQSKNFGFTGSKDEWCMDYYLSKYSSDPQVNPMNETKEYWYTNTRVARHGGLFNKRNNKEIFGRREANANFIDSSIGFRLCLPK